MEQDETAIAAPAAPAVAYAYRASLIGGAHEFDLTDQGLSWRIGGRSGLWPYAEIMAVNLSFRPVSMQSRRFRADIRHTSGSQIAVLSTTWQTVTLQAPQDHGYRSFIVELHRRMAEAGARAVLTAGLGPKTYAAAIAVLIVLAASMAALLARAVATGEFAGGLFVIGFAALFAWQVGGFIRRNRPVVYSYDKLPETVLPKFVA
ncbi:MAG: hypothetical protein HY852_22770 [Bradyrhizobium sp.]|uniref:hypothetical protein n=1 Tax=Bradyrhizobium sp. TaxID=376 RepID=UPI0025C25799|nr:hypothetical protein [Bradyrhizobium sp.]MBI5264628.1 hypothetical protein [Bradyrhizobium sp.]